MITKEFIEAFFAHKSEAEDRFIGFNFLYNETKGVDEYEKKNFDETTMSWIKKKENVLKSRIAYLNAIDPLENYVNISENIAVIEVLLEKQIIMKSWLETVKKVQKSYNEYLKEMNGTEIKYIIISEAPLLKFSKDQFSCNYILDKEIQSAGSYRTAPYHAINNIYNKDYVKEITKEISADDLITLCINYGIAFMDLIPIPLPELNTKLREHWSINQQYFIEAEKPRVITFLEIAFKYFIENTKCTIDPKVKIALMMPPKTSLGILNFFINDK